MILKTKTEFWWEDKEVVEHQIKSSSLAWMTVAPAAVILVSTYGWTWLLAFPYVDDWERIDMCSNRDCACLCVQACMRKVCAVLYVWKRFQCLSVEMCVCARVRMYDGGGGRAGIKHARSTSQRLGGPPSCSHGHTCKLDYPKNRSVEHNTLAQIDTHAPVSTQNRSLPVAPVSCRPVCDPRSTLPRTSSCRTDTSSGLEQQD